YSLSRFSLRTTTTSSAVGLATSNEYVPAGRTTPGSATGRLNFNLFSWLNPHACAAAATHVRATASAIGIAILLVIVVSSLPITTRGGRRSYRRMITRI